jgi:hypothetical protein
VSTQPTQDVTAIKNFAGTYSQQLIARMLNELDIAKDITVMRNVREPLNLTKFEAANGIRPLNVNVESAKSPGRKFTGRKLEPKGAMKIFHVNPEELRGTWMGEMLDPNAKDVPFAAWIWSKEFEALAAELNDNVYYSRFLADSADFNPAVVYNVGNHVNFNDDIYRCLSTTTAGQSPASHPARWLEVNATSIVDGPGTIIAQEITAAKLTPVVTGAISNTNAVASLQAVWKAQTIAVRKRGAVIYVSWDVFEKYLTDYDTRFGKGAGIASYIEDETVVYLKGSYKKCQLLPATWMGNSQRIICTPKANFLMGTNDLSDFNKIGKTVDTLHGFKAICKFLLCFNFADLEVLKVNDQA